ncbi:MAG TPA: ABC transporter permease, partial [Nocardioides sp.]
MLVLTLTDLKQRARDKSLLIFALVVPLALMTVFNFVFGATDEVGLRPVSVAVSVPAGDDLAAVVVDTVNSLEGGDAGREVSVGEVGETAARSLVEDGDAAVAVLVPDGFGEDVRTGVGPTVEAVKADDAGIEADIVLSVVDATLEQLDAGAVAVRAGLAEGVDHEAVASLVQEATAGGPAYTLE